MKTCCSEKKKETSVGARVTLPTGTGSTHLIEQCSDTLFFCEKTMFERKMKNKLDALDLKKQKIKGTLPDFCKVWIKMKDNPNCKKVKTLKVKS